MREKRKIYLKCCCQMIFIIYVLFLIKIILFKYRGLVPTLNMFIAGELSGFHSYNIIPFQSILEFTKLMFNGYFSRGFNNIIGNILVFAPFGYFLPLLYKKCRKWKTVILLAFPISFLFEILQYFLYLGSADIDDVILNLLGATLGFCFFQVIKRVTYQKQTQRYVATVVMSVIGFFVAGYLAVDYFGIMFGITNRGNQNDLSENNNILSSELTNDDRVSVIMENEQEDVSNEEDNKVESKDELDMYGFIIELSDSSITINRIKEDDFGNGKGVASINVEEPDIQTIYITETTSYMWKDIYDVNGNKVETREATKEDMEIDKNINIKGYQSDDKFYATEIMIENYLF